MGHVINLDQAVAELTSRLPARTTSELNPEPVAWRDEGAPWPQPLETDRALIAAPDSVGVRIPGVDEWTEVQIVLYRGGWTDPDAPADNEVTAACPQIATPAGIEDPQGQAFTALPKSGSGPAERVGVGRHGTFVKSTRMFV
ncbi:hypothetical protein ACFVH6_37355 [Spirillospora sp. NPDC127200]